LSSAIVPGTHAHAGGDMVRSLRWPSVLGHKTEPPDELPTTEPAVQGRLGGGRGLARVSGMAALGGLVMGGAGCQEFPALRQCWATAWTQDAVVADFDESLGQ